MRTFLLFLCSVLIGVNVYAQRPDSVISKTSVQVNEDGTVVQTREVKVITTRLYADSIRDDISVISQDDWITLFNKRKVISNQSFPLPLPASILKAQVCRASTQRTLLLDGNGDIQMLVPAATILSPETSDVSAWLSYLLWLFLPVGLTGKYLFRNRQKMTEKLIFFGINVLAMLFAILTGGLTGLIGGLIAGLLLGVCAVIFGVALKDQKLIDFAFCGPVGTFWAIWISGFYAGYISKFGFAMDSQEFSVMWGYLSIFAIICAVTIVAKELKLAYLSHNQQKTGKAVAQ